MPPKQRKIQDPGNKFYIRRGEEHFQNSYNVAGPWAKLKECLQGEKWNTIWWVLYCYEFYSSVREYRGYYAKEKRRYN